MKPTRYNRNRPGHAQSGTSGWMHAKQLPLTGSRGEFFRLTSSLIGKLTMLFGLKDKCFARHCPEHVRWQLDFGQNPFEDSLLNVLQLLDRIIDPPVFGRSEERLV